jgi:hypothetical protein
MNFLVGQSEYTGFEVHTEVTRKSTTFWDVRLCRIVDTVISEECTASETMVNLYQTLWYHIPEYGTLQHELCSHYVGSAMDKFQSEELKTSANGNDQ